MCARYHSQSPHHDACQTVTCSRKLYGSLLEVLQGMCYLLVYMVRYPSHRFITSYSQVFCFNQSGVPKSP
ncbi:hypothetical protein LINPERHAP1_LOCUS12655 [Linum perenne]